MVNYTKYWSYTSFRKESQRCTFSPFDVLLGKWYVVNYKTACFHKLMVLVPFSLEHVYEGIVFFRSLECYDSQLYTCTFFQNTLKPLEGVEVHLWESHLSATSWNSLLFSNRIYYILQTVHVYHTFPGLALFTDGLNKFFCLSPAFVQGGCS